DQRGSSRTLLPETDRRRRARSNSDRAPEARGRVMSLDPEAAPRGRPTATAGGPAQSVGESRFVGRQASRQLIRPSDKLHFLISAQLAGSMLRNPSGRKSSYPHARLSCSPRQRSHWSILQTPPADRARELARGARRFPSVAVRRRFWLADSRWPRLGP